MKELVLLQKKLSTYITLDKDYRKSDFNCIQTLHKMIDPNNKLIVEKRNGDRFPNGYMETQIFYDILLVISEGVCKDENLNDLYKNLYFQKYPRVITYIEKIKEYDNQEKVLDFVDSIEDPEKAFLISCLCDIEEEYDVLSFLNMDVSGYNNAFRTFKNDIYNSLLAFAYAGTNEPVFSSPPFEKFVNKMKERLIEYINRGETLTDAVESIISEMANIEKAGFCYSEYVSTVLKKFVFTNHCGNSAWLFQVINIFGEGKKYNYKPDIELLFKDYCISYVLQSSVKVMKKGEKFTKLYLARELFPEDMGMVLESLLDMYFMDCFYRMFDISQEIIYKNFTWEKYTKQSLNDLLLAENKRLQEELINIKNRNTTLNEKNLSLEKTIESDNKITSFSEYQEFKKLNKEIERLKYELIEEKKKNDSLEELLSIAEEDEDSKQDYFEIDINFLQTKRYLFVGRSKECFPELKSLFPNSIIISEESKDLSGIQVDAVVFLIRFLSHSLYYKVKKSNTFESAYCVNYNGKSLNGLLETIQKALINL